jgi:hypothetical protein
LGGPGWDDDRRAVNRPGAYASRARFWWRRWMDKAAAPMITHQGKSTIWADEELSAIAR